MPKIAFPIFIILIVLGVATTATVSAFQQRSDSGQLEPTQAEDNVVSHQNPSAGREVLSWSSDALEDAQPMPLHFKEGSPQQDSQRVQLSSGTPHTSPPVRPNMETLPFFAAVDTDIHVDTGYEQPYPPLFNVFAYFGRRDQYPTITYGALFFTQNNTAYRCSATLVYRNVIVTAGHCVHDGSNSENGWSSNFVFYPAYLNGAGNPWFTPNTYTNWTTSHVPSQWFSSEEYGRDYGFVVFDDSLGEFPGDTYGFAGFQTGFSEVQKFTMFGYPAEGSYGGNRVQVCYTSYSGYDTSVFPYALGFGCNFTGGGSGSGLVRRLDVYGGAINGILSYSYSAFPLEQYTPYFNDTTWNVYCTAAESDMDLSDTVEYRIDHPNCP